MVERVETEQHQAAGPGRYRDLTGLRFERLTVREVAGKGEGREVLWLCDCDCGGQTITRTANLNSGNTRSCGCLARERMWKPRPRDVGLVRRRLKELRAANKARARRVGPAQEGNDHAVAGE